MVADGNVIQIQNEFHRTEKEKINRYAYSNFVMIFKLREIVFNRSLMDNVEALVVA